MTEAEWLTSDDPQSMLWSLQGRASERKLRLFAAACCRKVAHMLTAEGQEGIELAERVAEGMASSAERKKGRAKTLQTNWLMDDAFISRRGPAKAAVCDALARRAYEAARGAACRTSRMAQGQCHLLRDVFHPYRPVGARLSWMTPTVTSLAQAAYDERALPAGSLESQRLAVLADALEEGGYADIELLGHLRSPGPHVRGCWALDLVLGKE
jgi:hypothetical protein